MKPFNTVPGHSSKGTRPRFNRAKLKNTVAISEDEAMYCNLDFGGARNISMRKSSGASWKTGVVHLSYTHVDRWFQSHVGQNVDKVFAEFVAALKMTSGIHRKTAKEYFEDHVWVPEVETQGKFGRTTDDWFRFTVDDQNRLILNPNFKTYKQYRRERTKKYSPEQVQKNQKVLESVKARLASDGESVGPIGLGPLWIVDENGQEKLEPVYLVRTAAYTGASLYQRYGSTDMPISKISARKIEDIREQFKPVSVITGETNAPTCWDVPMYSMRFWDVHKSFTFLVRK